MTPPTLMQKRKSLHRIGQHLLRMLARIHLRVCGFDFPMLIDQIADATGVPGLGIRARAVGETELAIGVAQQFVGKIEFLGECGVGVNSIEAHAQNHNAVFFEIGIIVAEPATFNRSSRRIGLGIEPQQNFTAAQRRQCHRRAVMRCRREVWR